MNLVDADLAAATKDGLASIDPRIHAQAQNVRLEENVSGLRQNSFETESLGTGGPSWTQMRRRHIDYVRRFVWTATEPPHTFRLDLIPAKAEVLDEEQFLVRLEKLAWPLSRFGCTFEDLDHAIRDDDQRFIDAFLERWNEVRDYRPMFATFLREVASELASSEWPELLRDALGLAHFVPTTGPEPVALFKYRVRTVLSEAQGSIAITVPTVLDSDPWEHFFPAPKGLEYGRAMALSPCVDDEDLRAEVLHSRIDYRTEHLSRVGIVTKSPPINDLKYLRELHLLALQIASGREDFGS